MKKYPQVSRQDAVNIILRVIRLPVALVNDEDKKEAQYYSIVHRISVLDIIDAAYENIKINE
jgi:hypothetical protein